MKKRRKRRKRRRKRMRKMRTYEMRMVRILTKRIERAARPLRRFLASNKIQRLNKRIVTLEQKNRDSTDVYDALSLKLKNETKTISREMAKVRILKDLLIKERGKKTSNSTEVKRLESELKTKVGEITLKSEELQNTQKALAMN
jgi:effector-binding domain-containing protein